MKKALVLPVVAALFFAFVLLFVKVGGTDFLGALLGIGPRLSYKAVFLTNGQVYFGKVQKTEAQTITLTDVFYLKTKEIDPKDPKQATAAAQLELVKPGAEIYGPKDTLIVNRRQILVIQDLKEDSPVVRGIARYYQTVSSSTGSGPTKTPSRKGKVEVKSE